MRAVRRRRRRGGGLAVERIASFGILDFEAEIDGSGGLALCMPAGGSLRPASQETVDERLHFVKQDGQAVFRFAVRKTEEMCRRLLERNGLQPGDIDLMVSHQANRRIILSAAERLGFPAEKVVINIDELRQHHRRPRSRSPSTTRWRMAG